MIRLNYGCDKRVCYFVLIFMLDIDPSVSTIQWDLKKPACGWTDDLARVLTEKISCPTQKCNFWKRPSTDFDKNYIFGIGTSSAIEWCLSLLLSISWPSDEPCDRCVSTSGRWWCLLRITAHVQLAKAPLSCNKFHYWNYKHSYSTILAPRQCLAMPASSSTAWPQRSPVDLGP